MIRGFAVWFTCALIAGCSPAPEAVRTSLIEQFDSATVENAFTPIANSAPIEWRFDGESPVATGGWEAVHGITGLAVRNDRLVGRVGEHAILAAPTPDALDADDVLHAVEVRLRVSAGERLGVGFGMGDELDEETLVTSARENPRWPFDTELIPGDDVQTYTLTSADSTFLPSFPLSGIRHVLIYPSDEPGAEFEIESVRLISLREHLSSIESGIGWHGLGDIFRETIVSRSPERVVFDVEVPSASYLELAIGTVDSGPVSFRVELDDELLLARTVSTPHRWETVPIDLTALAGRRGSLSFILEAAEAGTLGFWGTPVIRRRTTAPTLEPSSTARAAVLGNDAPPPQGVIVILIDTLRRDYFQPYGHGRDNAPVLTAMAAEGALFEDAIAQATWTKVSAPAILTSLYPSTHGISDMPDRLPAAVTTLAEAYREAGFATFATSSVPFTGKLSNLHQGVDVLHERSSIPDVPMNYAKTGRTYVDRVLPWLEQNRDVPFFAFLHVFDPHTPFEPYPPYDAMWMEPDALLEHREHLERVADVIDHTFRKEEVLPFESELEAAGVDRDTFLEREKIWYDASIRAMDVEIGRLVERLRELELSESTLVAVISDHGEEFLEHGRHFHGYTAYGEMLNIPLFLWWPKAVPSGLRIAETVEAIDLMPSLLELSGLPFPEEVQGQSLVPLLAEGTRPGELGWRSRPAFAERRYAPAAFSDDERKLESFAIIGDGWKLIRNTERPEGWPEYELFDHVNDPLNLNNVAADEPEIIERLAEQLEAWREATLAARIEADESTEGISAEELQRLRSLGYVQ